ncbi:HAD family hydrolase [Gallaecimonas pentaromativorans]|uniref:HAD family hydrolase n=1 Tax=Gallaecimonas pentaromativorans TaxID=584787 RepID=UPI00067F70D6|nr:HAD-IB family hydrolase [Gallaecimonas pentaromativorans]
MPKNLVIFDFCDTLVRSQTADEFVHYVTEIKDIKRKIVSDFIREWSNKFKIVKALNFIFPKLNINKRLLLFKLRGISKVELDTLGEMYARNVLREKENSSIIDRLKEHQKQGDEIVVISGGYDTYIKHFMKIYGVDRCICTNLKYNHSGVFTGFIDGVDCLNEEKVSRLRSSFSLENYQQTICYSDSITDLPILRACHIGIVVSYHYRTDWANEMGLKEIIIK